MTLDAPAFIRALMRVNLALAGRAAASPELLPNRIFKQEALERLILEVQQALIARTQDMNADLRARIAAGLALGSLGDPRFERRSGPHGDYLLPPLASIPAGDYPMGSAEDKYDDEAPAHRVSLARFQMGVFPVTNAEYALFIAAGGYADERWWKTDAAKAWREGQVAPAYWKDGTYNNPAQPVVGVCWYEACTYCAWLSAQTGRMFRLPTEAEFEAAARGMNRRKYPYGQRFDGARCNTFESHIRRTTPVGVFRNATPEGVLDLSGNVYTWTSSIYQPYPYRANDGREDVNRGEPRVVRGGSWSLDQNLARASFGLNLPDRSLQRLGVSGGRGCLFFLALYSVALASGL
jgi:formylglycine-generating enzyme required for sulfatase activity